MKRLIRKQNMLLKKLEMCSAFLRGTINSVCATCNRAQCVCKKETSSKAYRLTYKDARQKTRILYIPQGRLPEVKRMIANYSQWRKTTEQLMESNIEIFKAKGRK